MWVRRVNILPIVEVSGVTGKIERVVRVRVESGCVGSATGFEMALLKVSGSAAGSFNSLMCLRLTTGNTLQASDTVGWYWFELAKSACVRCVIEVGCTYRAQVVRFPIKMNRFPIKVIRTPIKDTET